MSLLFNILSRLVITFLPRSLAQFIHSAVSDSLWPHEPQHLRPPCPSPTPGVHSNPCPSSRWCHPTISSSVIPFSSCPQSFPASGSFQISQLFASGGQSNISPSNECPGLISFRKTGWISLQSLDMVIPFLPRSKCLLILWLQSPSCSDFGAQNNKVSHCFPIYLPWSDGTRCHDLSFLNVELKPTFSLSSFTFIKRLFSSSSLSVIRWCHLHIWGYWYFSWQSWFQSVLPPAQYFSSCTLPIR